MSSAIATDNDVHDHHDTNSHPDIHLALDLRGALADHGDDADTASQHSISFSSSPAASPRDSTFSELSLADAPRRRLQPFIVSTESSGPDDTNLYSGRRSNSVNSHGQLSLVDSAKTVPPTPLTAAIQNNVYPPAQIQSPGHSSVASFETSTSSYSKKARPESLLPDPPKGPLVLGVALVDFNHQVMLLNFCHKTAAAYDV